MLYISSHILLHYELNVYSIGQLLPFTTSTASYFKKGLVVLIVSTDACMKGVESSNPADD